MKFSIPVNIYFSECDREIEVWCNVTNYYPGDPGKYSGPPENCYPAESPEIEYFLSWKDNGKYSVFLNEWLWNDSIDHDVREYVFNYLEGIQND